MAYQVFIDSWLLPVTPPEIKMKIKNLNKTVNLINESEVNLVKLPGLTDISFTALLPNIRYPFAAYLNGFQRADYYLGLLEALKTQKRTFQFIVSRALPDGMVLAESNPNFTVTLEDYQPSEGYENGFDVSVAVNLKSWTDYGTKTAAVQSDGSDGQPAVSAQNDRKSDPARIAVGSRVTVSGRLYRDSYGGGPGKVLSNYSGVVSIIANGRDFPYHISDSGGGWLGWVAAASVTGVG